MQRLREGDNIYEKRVTCTRREQHLQGPELEPVHEAGGLFCRAMEGTRLGLWKEQRLREREQRLREQNQHLREKKQYLREREQHLRERKLRLRERKQHPREREQIIIDRLREENRLERDVSERRSGLGGSSSREEQARKSRIREESRLETIVSERNPSCSAVEGGRNVPWAACSAKGGGKSVLQASCNDKKGMSSTKDNDGVNETPDGLFYSAVDGGRNVPRAACSAKGGGQNFLKASCSGNESLSPKKNAEGVNETPDGLFCSAVEGGRNVPRAACSAKGGGQSFLQASCSTKKGLSPKKGTDGVNETPDGLFSCAVEGGWNGLSAACTSKGGGESVLQASCSA